MKTYWRGTSIRVSKFRLWVASLVIPKTVWECWERQEKSRLKHIEQLRSEKFRLDLGLGKAKEEALASL